MIVSFPPDRVASIRERFMALAEAPARRVCLAHAVRPGGRVLELGVGTGVLFERLVRANPAGYTVGVDPSDRMLARARARMSSVSGRYRLTVDDARHLESESRAFDSVVSCHLFDLLPEHEFATVLGEARRVLARGGRLVLMNLAATAQWLGLARDAAHRVCPRLTAGHRGVAIGDYVAAMGFSDVRTTLLRLPGFTCELVTAQSSI